VFCFIPHISESAVMEKLTGFSKRERNKNLSAWTVMEQDALRSIQISSNYMYMYVATLKIFCKLVHPKPLKERDRKRKD
jgi:hypothetical protein